MADGWRNVAQVKPEDRGYDWAWRKLRKRILERDRYLCLVCLAQGVATPANEVDHITNKASGGTDDETNLQAICKHCHELKTYAEAQAARLIGKSRG